MGGSLGWSATVLAGAMREKHPAAKASVQHRYFLLRSWPHSSATIKKRLPHA
jgi:hypothetical protein